MKSFSVSSYRSASLRALGIKVFGQEVQVLLWGRDTARLQKRLLTFGRYRFAGARGIEIVLLGRRIQIFKPGNETSLEKASSKAGRGFPKFAFGRRHVQFTRFDGRVYIYPWGDCLKLTWHKLTKAITLKRCFRRSGSLGSHSSQETLYQVVFDAFNVRCCNAEEALLATGDDSQLKALSNQVMELVYSFIQHDLYIERLRGRTLDQETAALLERVKVYQESAK